MNPNLCKLALRPRGPLEVFDLALVFLRARSRSLGRLAMVTVLPVWLVTAVVGAWLGGHPLILLVPVVLGPVLQAPFTVLGGRAMFSDDVGTLEVLVHVARAAPRLVASWLVGAGAWLLTAMTLFMGWPFVQSATLFLPEAILLEQVGPRRALRRSMRLAGGHLLVAMTGNAAQWALLVYCVILGEVCGQYLVGSLLQLGAPFGDLLHGSVTPWALLGAFLAHPLIALYRLLLYVDVRTRIEGWDLQVALRALGLESR